METNALNKIGYGLYVITSKHNGKDNGCIVNTVSQVTFSPDKIMVCINNSGYTCEMIKESGIFNISVLKEETPFYVFEHFGFLSGREKDKFEKTDNLFRSENGLLHKALTSVSIRCLLQMLHFSMCSRMSRP